MLTRHDGTAGSHVLLLLRSELRHILEMAEEGNIRSLLGDNGEVFESRFQVSTPSIVRRVELRVRLGTQFERRRLHLICKKVQPLRYGPSRILARLLQSLFGLLIELFGDVAVRENAEDCDGKKRTTDKEHKNPDGNPAPEKCSFEFHGSQPRLIFTSQPYIGPTIGADDVIKAGSERNFWHTRPVFTHAKEIEIGI